MGKKIRALQKKEEKLVEAASAKTLKLDLGCGQNPKEGFEGVDIRGGKATHVCDLFKFPWGFASDSVDEIHCSHFLEHVPAREIELRDMISGDPDVQARFLGQDMLFAFMDECYRIMKMDAWMHIVVPSGRSSRAFWDPTHRRFFMQETFLYFAHDWRKMNGLDHYRVMCNFLPEIGNTALTEESLLSAPVARKRFMHYWNTTVDWVGKLKKAPLPPAT